MFNQQQTAPQAPAKLTYIVNLEIFHHPTTTTTTPANTTTTATWQQQHQQQQQQKEHDHVCDWFKTLGLQVVFLLVTSDRC